MQTFEQQITESARLLARYYVRRDDAYRRGLTDRVARWDRHITREGANLDRLQKMSGRRLCRQRGSHRFHELYSDAGCGDCGATEGGSDD